MTLAALILALATLLGVLPAPAEALNGRATWYDAPSPTDAAAGPILREWLGKGWRGTWVEVCKSDEAAVSGPIAGLTLDKDFTSHLTDASRSHRWGTPSIAPASSKADCITVQLTDWCLCSKDRRLIDLDDRSFAKLGPLSRGVLSVTVERVDVRPPSTDTAP